MNCSENYNNIKELIKKNKELEKKVNELQKTLDYIFMNSTPYYLGNSNEIKPGKAYEEYHQRY